MGGEDVASKLPHMGGTREGLRFLGWFDGETKVESTTTFTAKTTLVAKWELTTTVQTYVVNLTGQTTENTEAWTAAYNNGFAIKIGDDFNVNLYDTVEIICKFYEEDGTTELAAIEDGNFQLKWHAEAVANANGANVGTKYNFGKENAEANTGPEGGLKITYTIPVDVKTAGLWGIGIQTSGGPFAAQFVEVLSITFTE
jgi:hypothetical protein